VVGGGVARVGREKKVKLFWMDGWMDCLHNVRVVGVAARGKSLTGEIILSLQYNLCCGRDQTRAAEREEASKGKCE
jgi:hypothetical protein